MIMSNGDQELSVSTISEAPKSMTSSQTLENKTINGPIFEILQESPQWNTGYNLSKMIFMSSGLLCMMALTYMMILTMFWGSKSTSESMRQIFASLITQLINQN